MGAPVIILDRDVIRIYRLVSTRALQMKGTAYRKPAVDSTGPVRRVTILWK
jgi:hypothetical protein